MYFFADPYLQFAGCPYAWETESLSKTLSLPRRYVDVGGGQNSEAQITSCTSLHIPSSWILLSRWLEGSEYWQEGFTLQALFTSRVFEGMRGDYFVSQNFPNRLFTSPGFEGIIPRYPHKSPLL
jgi:uncharacterized SAM-binding protein YcdF (DUF218 family)